MTILYSAATNIYIISRHATLDGDGLGVTADSLVAAGVGRHASIVAGMCARGRIHASMAGIRDDLLV